MLNFRDVAIKHKLTVIMMAVTSVAVLLACVAFVTYDEITFRSKTARDFSILADMFDDNVAPALMANDTNSMQGVLKTLSADSHIVTAAVFNKEGNIVAKFNKESDVAIPAVQPTASYFDARRLNTFQTITQNGTTLGTVYIGSDLRERSEHFMRFALIALAVLLTTCGLGLVLSARLRTVITGPISDLGEVVRNVTMQRDYSTRAVKRGDDELGHLIDGFNDMLSQIQSRDNALQKAHNELEDRIRERTSELQSEVSERKKAETFLKSVLDNLPITVFIKEPQAFRYLLWNKAGEELTGRLHSEIVGKNDSDFSSKEVTERLSAIDLETLQRRELVESEEEVQTVSKGKRILFTRRIPIFDETRKPLYLLGISEDITDRKMAEAHLEKIHRELIDASRRAGMAEVATGVLHNVGNVLNSVNVSATLVAEQVKQSKVFNLAKISELLSEHAQDLGSYLTKDPQGIKLPGFVEKLSVRLAAENARITKEIEALCKSVEHIKDIVALQQNYATVSGVAERVCMEDIVEDAIRMNETGLTRHEIRIVRDFPSKTIVTTEKHKVLQILINLVRNAKYACTESDRAEKEITVRVADDSVHIFITVTDNGVGIPAENLNRIFNHGFTTRKNGHGFGLHSGALAASELGGSLSVKSEGAGKGARFTLSIPVHPLTRQL